MVARFGFYILFLVTLFMYFKIIVYAQQRQMQTVTQKKGGVFLSGQVMILAGLIPIVVIPWILAGFFSKRFALAVLIAFEVSALLLSLFYAVFGIAPREVMNNMVMWGAEIGFKHPRLFPKGFQIFGLLVMGGYFLTASYMYFAHPRGSAPGVRGILIINMVLFLGGTLFGIVPTVLQIASAVVSSNTRRALFVSQAATALQMGVIFTVYLGLLGIGGEKFVPIALSIPHMYSQYLPMALLLVFYLLIIIVPYFVGLESRRRKEILLYGSVLDRISRAIDAVGVPGKDDLNQLTELRAQFKKETDAWVETQPIVLLAREIDKIDPEAEGLDPNIRTVVVAYEDFKVRDPRILNLKAMDVLDKKLEEVIGEYVRIQPSPNEFELHISLNRSVESHLRDQRQYYAGMIKGAEDTKVVAPVLARLVAVVGAVPIVMQYGQKLVQILTTSH